MGFIWLVIIPVAITAWVLGWICKTHNTDDTEYFMAPMPDDTDYMRFGQL